MSQVIGEAPSNWSVPKLSEWLGKDKRLDAEAIDALSLCDVDGRMFLEMDEEDLAESEELGLDRKNIHVVLQLQQKLEELELTYRGNPHPIASTSLPPPAASSREAVVHPTPIPPIASSVPTAAAAAASSASPGVAKEKSSCSSSWTLPCVSVDADGNSYFTEKTVPLGPGTGAGIGALSQLFPAAGVKFRETPGDYDFDFHTAPAKQLIASLDAGVEIEVTDGTRVIFPAGTVMLVEDTWGKGHRSRAVNGKSRKSLFVLLPDDFHL